MPIPVMTPSSKGDDARHLRNETFRWLSFRARAHLIRHRVWRSSGEDDVVTLSRYLLEVSAGATTRDHVVAVRHLMPSPVEGRKREDTRLRLGRTPGVKLSLRTSAAPDLGARRMQQQNRPRAACAGSGLCAQEVPLTRRCGV